MPAATRALRVLRFLGTQPEPVPADRIARALGIPRSSVYHLLDTMVDEGFVAYLADDHRFGLGVASYEVGSGYVRQAPLQRLARKPLHRLVDATGESAHLAVLHGRDVLYLIEERAPGGPSLVTDVGVRLPAHLAASGRAMLARLPSPQIRALYPDRSAFVDRNGVGPRSLTALRPLLADVRAHGYAEEDGEITTGFASVAAAVVDHTGHPVAGIAVTFESAGATGRADLVTEVVSAADGMSQRLRGPRPQ